MLLRKASCVAEIFRKITGGHFDTPSLGLLGVNPIMDSWLQYHLAGRTYLSQAKKGHNGQQIGQKLSKKKL